MIIDIKKWIGNCHMTEGSMPEWGRAKDFIIAFHSGRGLIVIYT